MGGMRLLDERLWRILWSRVWDLLWGGFEVDVVTLQQLTAATDPVLIMPGRPLTSRQW